MNHLTHAVEFPTHGFCLPDKPHRALVRRAIAQPAGAALKRCPQAGRQEAS